MRLDKIYDDVHLCRSLRRLTLNLSRHLSGETMPYYSSFEYYDVCQYASV